MSKGIGRVERAILETLAGKDETFATWELAAAVYGVKPDAEGFTPTTDAQQAAVRRAVLTLARKGLAARAGRSRKDVLWATPRVAEMLRQERHVDVAATLAELRSMRGK